MKIRLTEQEAAQLLDTLCVKLGFCLGPKMTSRLTKNPPASAEKFASTVYRIEGLDPNLRSDLYEQVLYYANTAFQYHLNRADTDYNV